eukprot:945473-Pelagomonas_calceolata.AAC.4
MGRGLVEPGGSEVKTQNNVYIGCKQVMHWRAVPFVRGRFQEEGGVHEVRSLLSRSKSNPKPESSAAAAAPAAVDTREQTKPGTDDWKGMHVHTVIVLRWLAALFRKLHAHFDYAEHCVSCKTSFNDWSWQNPNISPDLNLAISQKHMGVSGPKVFRPDP